MHQIPYRQVITPQIEKLFARVNPDTLVTVAGSHGFIYTDTTGLLVDPDTCRSHASWYGDDQGLRLSDLSYYAGNDLMAGRYANFWGIPVAVFWRFHRNGHMLKPAARSLVGELPKGTVAVIIGTDANEVVLLRDLAGIRSMPQGRGHQYWQRRQTSESSQRTANKSAILRESALPTHQVLDDDLNTVVSKISPDELLMTGHGHNSTSFIYTADGELIRFADKDNYGHAEYVGQHRRDIPQKYGTQWYDHCVCARFAPLTIHNNYSRYNDQTINILSVWAYKTQPLQQLLIPAFKAIIPHVPPDTYVTTGVGSFGSFASFPLSMLGGGGRPQRGHRYWQRRQTSESRH